MRAGNLNRRVAFQARGAGKDALGQQLVGAGWIDVATAVPAAIKPLSGRARMVAQANQSELTHTVTIRYQAQFADPKVMAAMRILYGARIFNIHAAIDPDERHRSLELSCSEGLNDG